MTLSDVSRSTGQLRRTHRSRTISRGRLITVSGIDCSGKTTQLDLLEEALGRGGEQIVRFWLRPGYSPELDWLRHVVRRMLPRALPTTFESAARDRTFRKPSVRKTWLSVALLDLIAQYGGKVRVLLAAGRTVLCDRYIHDAFLDLTLRFPDLRSSEAALARVAALVAPTPDSAFLLHVSKEEMLRRMVQKREPFPDDAATRDARYAAYLRFPAEHGVISVDASRTPAEVHSDIMSHLGPARAFHARR